MSIPIAAMDMECGWPTRLPPSAAQNLATATSLSEGIPSARRSRLPHRQAHGFTVDVGVGQALPTA